MARKPGSYRDLIVWKKALELARLLYQLTQTPSFPREERYGLISQMRRAGVSVPSNVAEGQARRTTKEFVQFLYVAKGSLAELDTQCIIARDLGYLAEDRYQHAVSRIEELQRMLFSLIGKLQAKPRT